MEERARFVLDALERRFSMTELCYRYGMPEANGEDWIEIQFMREARLQFRATRCVGAISEKSPMGA